MDNTNNAALCYPNTLDASQREGYRALEMTNARRFEFGVPDDFVRSVQEFRSGN